MPLADTAIRNAKPKERQYKLSDERGLYLLVLKSDKYFRWDYRFMGKRKTMALGVYPDTSLAQARDKRDIARKKIAEAIQAQGGKDAVNLRVAEQYIGEFGKLAKDSNTLVLPASVADVGSMIALAMNVINKKPGKTPTIS